MGQFANWRGSQDKFLTACFMQVNDCSERVEVGGERNGTTDDVVCRNQLPWMT